MRKKLMVDAKDQAGLTAKLIEISKANPRKAVTASVVFGKVTVYINASLARIPVDSPDVRQMLSAYNGYIAFVDGKTVKPTAGWLTRRKADEARIYGDR